MSVSLQIFLLRWLPLSIIVIAEYVLLVPLRGPVLAGTTWGPFAALLAFGFALVMLIDLRDLTDIRTRIPNPNGLTIPQYVGQLLWFALAIAPVVFVPMRR